MRIPLHLSNEITEASALARVELHTAMSMITEGKGFRFPGKNSKITRIEKIAEKFYG